MDQAEFYAQSATRRLSPELDYGVWWYDRDHDPWRVSWVERTGEIIAVAQRTGQVEILGRLGARHDVERVLEGWADICGSADSLDWVRLRLLTEGVAV